LTNKSIRKCTAQAPHGIGKDN